MAEERIFKKVAIGGFDKDDVMDYIAVLKEKEAKKNARITTLESEVDKLSKIGQTAADALQSKAEENDSLKKELDEARIALELKDKLLSEEKANHARELAKVKSDYDKLNSDLSKNKYTNERLSSDIGTAVVDARRFADMIFDEATKKVDNIATRSDLAAQSMIDDLSAVTELMNVYNEKVSSAFAKIIKDNVRMTEELADFKGSLLEPITELRDEFYVKKPILNVNVNSNEDNKENVVATSEPTADETAEAPTDASEVVAESAVSEAEIEASTEEVTDEKTEHTETAVEENIAKKTEENTEPEEEVETGCVTAESADEEKAYTQIENDSAPETEEPVTETPEAESADDVEEEKDVFSEEVAAEIATITEEPVATVTPIEEKADEPQKPLISDETEKPAEKTDVSHSHRYGKIKSGVVTPSKNAEERASEDVKKMFEEALKRQSGQQENSDESFSKRTQRYGKISR